MSSLLFESLYLFLLEDCTIFYRVFRKESKKIILTQVTIKVIILYISKICPTKQRLKHL